MADDTDKAQLILYRLDAQDKILKSIDDHAALTNGRVTKLERWQSYMWGFGAAISIIVLGVLIPLAVALLANVKL